MFVALLFIGNFVKQLLLTSYFCLMANLEGKVEVVVLSDTYFSGPRDGAESFVWGGSLIDCSRKN